MPHHAQPMYCDTPHAGGWFIHDAFNLNTLSGQLLLLTRNALGDYSLNRTAAGAENYNVVFGFDDLKRLIEAVPPSAGSPLPFQEQFGTAAGGPGFPATRGFPPFAGASQLTPPTAWPPKGVQITDCTVIYQVGVAALTAASLSLNRTVFANNVANAVTNLPLGGSALSLPTQANPYVAVLPVTTPVFETADLSDLTLEFAFTMANTGTIRVYGLGMHLLFNYN